MIRNISGNSALYWVVILVMLLAVLSCSKSVTVTEVLTIEEVLGEDSTSEKITNEEVIMPELDGTFVGEINQKLYRDYRTTENKKTTLLDRFSTVSIEKTTYVALNDSLAVANFFLYNFSDTSATSNAFNNWLACFGNACEEIVLKENKIGVEERALWCGVYETAIVVIKFSDNALAFKDELKQTVFQTKGQALKYTLNVTPERQLKWD